MKFASIFGLIGGVFTTLSFLPQVIRVLKTRSTKDLSFSTFILFVLGLMFWFIYGILIVEWPIIISNLITLILAGTILVFKVIYK